MKTQWILWRLALTLIASLVLGACASRTPTVTIPDGTQPQELVSKSQKRQDFAILDIPFVLPSEPKNSAHVDLKFLIRTRGYGDKYTPSLVYLNGMQVKEIDFRTLSGDQDAIHHVTVQLPQTHLKAGENLLTMDMGG